MSDKNKIGYRPTWAEVNLKNLEHNYKLIKSLLNKGTKILVTVKADAYGHGLIQVARRLVKAGVDYLGVASIDEGIKLRKAGINTPILLLGLILKKDIGALFKYSLTPTVCDMALALAINKQAAKLKKKFPLHIKVDTGMGRIGVLHNNASGFIKQVSKLKNIEIEGIFTHFTSADFSRKFTGHQIKLFEKIITDLEKDKIKIPLVHAANSIGLIDYKHSHFNMVRPGLIIYGLRPKNALRINLKPVLSLKTRIIFSKQVPGGSGISYGRTYVTSKPTRIVTLPIGYGDGYPRNLSNRAHVLIGGKKFRISGRVCMDQIMVDVGRINPRIGDEVVLIGRQGAKSITAEELARMSDTISYEIVCGLGNRIPRVYI